MYLMLVKLAKNTFGTLGLVCPIMFTTTTNLHKVDYHQTVTNTRKLRDKITKLCPFLDRGHISEVLRLGISHPVHIYNA